MFEALADPTRRAVLRDVAEQGPRTATELAADLPVSRQAIAKHLAVLHGAGLVTSARTGRETLFTATAGPLAEAGQWLDRTGRAWEEPPEPPRGASTREGRRRLSAGVRQPPAPASGGPKGRR